MDQMDGARDALPECFCYCVILLPFLVAGPDESGAIGRDSMMTGRFRLRSIRSFGGGRRRGGGGRRRGLVEIGLGTEGPHWCGVEWRVACEKEAKSKKAESQH